MIAVEKRIWTPEEDDALRRLWEEGDGSWSGVAKRLAGELGFPRKSAKQCRER